MPSLNPAKMGPSKREKAMNQRSEVFEKNYNYYVEQLRTINFKSIENRLGVQCHDDGAQIDFLNNTYWVSRDGITDSSGNRPDYGICVILSKYFCSAPIKLTLIPNGSLLKILNGPPISPMSIFCQRHTVCSDQAFFGQT